MIRKLVIPKELGDVEVRMLDWVKAAGESVNVGDALLEFETDKAIVLVTAAQPGFLRRVLVSSGDWMKPGDTTAWLSDESNEPLPEADAALDEIQVNFEIT